MYSKGTDSKMYAVPSCMRCKDICGAKLYAVPRYMYRRLYMDTRVIAHIAHKASCGIVGHVVLHRDVVVLHRDVAVLHRMVRDVGVLYRNVAVLYRHVAVSCCSLVSSCCSLMLQSCIVMLQSCIHSLMPMPTYSSVAKRSVTGCLREEFPTRLSFV